MSEDLAVPTVSGTNKQMLRGQITDAIDALNEAGVKLAAALPNAPDYPQGDDALKTTMLSST